MYRVYGETGKFAYVLFNMLCFVKEQYGVIFDRDRKVWLVPEEAL